MEKLTFRATSHHHDQKWFPAYDFGCKWARQVSGALRRASGKHRRRLLAPRNGPTFRWLTITLDAAACLEITLSWCLDILYDCWLGMNWCSLRGRSRSVRIWLSMLWRRREY